MDTKFNWQKWLSILVAISPVIGYALAYVHELGYYDFFKIPTELIILDWTTALVAIAASLVILSILFWFATAVVLSKLENVSPIRQKIAFFIITALFLFILAFRYLTVEETKQLGIFTLLLLVTILIIRWIIRNYGEIPINRSHMRSDIKQNATAVYFRRLLGSKYLKFGFLAIYILVFIFLFTYLDGRSVAMNRQVFYIPSTHPESIVVKIQGDNLICAPLYYMGKDNRGKEIGIINQEFFKLNLNDSNISIKAIKLYLRVKE